ncbi:Hypothetical protein SM11_pD0443 (plasmid) [Sinorhizobium meliloti SM11]|uniref:Uncharacterized protein n=1 Tax=Sinorhizobium meliloti (strain SM11) TaxID=707241 RepID=F7XJU7_SINMM|nr:Hypothetical protein SM11_pD0443 [Sinorhizobium meliloti SM11]
MHVRHRRQAGVGEETVTKLPARTSQDWRVREPDNHQTAFCRLHRCSPNRPSAVHLPRRPPNIGYLRSSAGLPALRSVEIHLESKTVAARWMMALLLALISVLVTEIQRRRVGGAENVLSAQGLGLAGSL